MNDFSCLGWKPQKALQNKIKARKLKNLKYSLWNRFSYSNKKIKSISIYVDLCSLLEIFMTVSRRHLSLSLALSLIRCSVLMAPSDHMYGTLPLASRPELITLIWGLRQITFDRTASTTARQRQWSPNSLFSDKPRISIFHTHSDNVQRVITHFADFSILIMHQVNEVRWSLYKSESKEKTQRQTTVQNESHRGASSQHADEEQQSKGYVFLL